MDFWTPKVGMKCLSQHKAISLGEKLGIYFGNFAYPTLELLKEFITMDMNDCQRAEHSIQ